jgi:hypothetical protein
MGVRTAPLNWSPMPQRILGRSLLVVVVAAVVDGARVVADTDEVVVRGRVVLGTVRLLGTAVKDPLVASAIAILVIRSSGWDAASTKANSTETAMGARLRKLTSGGPQERWSYRIVRRRSISSG